MQRPERPEPERYDTYGGRVWPDDRIPSLPQLGEQVPSEDPWPEMRRANEEQRRKWLAWS